MLYNTDTDEWRDQARPIAHYSDCRWDILVYISMYLVYTCVYTFILHPVSKLLNL